MHTAALRALRSTCRSPARFVCHRRYPSPLHTRHFRTSTATYSSSHGPFDPDAPSTSSNSGSESKSGRHEAPEVAEAEEPNSPALEERFLRSKKEGHNGYGSTMRRSTRSRLKEIPAVKIPDWFLTRNVKLAEDYKTKDTSNYKQCEYVVADNETGAVLARLPILLPAELLEVLDHKHLAEKRLSHVLKSLRRLTLSGTTRASESNEVLSSALRRGTYFLALKSNEAAESSTPPVGDLGGMSDLQLAQRVLEVEKSASNGASSTPDDFSASHDSHVLSNAKAPKDGQLPQQEKESANNRRGNTDFQSDQFYIGVPPSLQSASSCSISFQLATEIRASISALLEAPTFRPDNIYADARNTLVLHSPLDGGIEFLDQVVEQIAAEQGSDIIALDAQDLAELGADYIGDGQEPSLQGIRSLGYETHRSEVDDLDAENAPAEESEEAEDSEEPSVGNIETSWRPTKPTIPAELIPLANPRALQDLLKTIERSGIPGLASGTRISPNTELYAPAELRRNPAGKHWEEMKFNALLEVLLETAESKRQRIKSSGESNKIYTENTIQDQLQAVGSTSSSATHSAEDSDQLILWKDSAMTISLHQKPSSRRFQSSSRPSTIILLRDFKELQASHQGSQIIGKLLDIIQRRRKEGERILLIGTTSSAELTPDLSPGSVTALENENQGPEYHTIFVPFGNAAPENATLNQERLLDALCGKQPEGSDRDVFTQADSRRKAAVNIRHINSMIKYLNPAAKLLDNIDSRLSAALRSEFMPFWKVHRLVVTAIGLQQTATIEQPLNSSHLLLSLLLIESSDAFKQAWVAENQRNKKPVEAPAAEEPGDTYQEQEPQQHTPRPKVVDIDALKKTCNKHERRLLHGVINSSAIKTTFDFVHAPLATIDALKTLTSLSLIRPDAFTYGVLAADKIPGLLLYGPPGTGKTLLAKAVAKESGATVLEVSGSEVYDMYVGEGEKNVRAIFSLARKLSPCVVFIDEADAIFRSRSGSHSRNSQREIINQFLREWDGMNDLSVFIMVATNRPFDLDDAVLRRLPRRLLIDLPTEKDRESILKIHLDGEILDPSISLYGLAQKTPFYSGSDLKNLCVAAALACVREENTLAAEAKAKQIEYQYPTKRVLREEHFEKAIEEISASISEDMESLSAIRKFDEQYGERKSRRKKAWGFGNVDEALAEKAARVRQG